MNDPGKFAAFLRRLRQGKTLLPIGNSLSVSWLELHAAIFFICCVTCSCCSISSYLGGSASPHLSKPAPTRTLRPTRTATPTWTPSPTSAPSPTWQPKSATPTQPPAPTATQRPPPSPTSEPTSEPTSTPTCTPTPTQTPEPTLTPTPTATPTASPTPPHTPQTTPPSLTDTPQPTDTPTPTPIPADLHVAYVEYNPPGADLDGEYVLIENLGAGSQDMTGWTLSDDNFNTYFFPVGFILGGEASVHVWTKGGDDTATDLYWGRGDPVWGNPDTATLRDNAATVIDSLSW